MRRLITSSSTSRPAVALSVLLATAATMLAVPTADAGEPQRSVEVRRVWKVAGGGAEARFRVLCQPEDGFTLLGAGLSQEGLALAGDGMQGVPCTGQLETVVLALPLNTDEARVVAGDAVVSTNLWNCIERDPCFEMPQDVPTTVNGPRPFVSPFDEDYQSHLELIHSRVLSDGRARVVYDLTCDGVGYAMSPVRISLTQVTPRGRVVRGTGEWYQSQVGQEVEVTCTETPTRFRVVLTPARRHFRAGTGFIDATWANRYDWGVYAEHSRPVQLTR